MGNSYELEKFQKSLFRIIFITAAVFIIFAIITSVKINYKEVKKEPETTKCSKEVIIKYHTPDFVLPFTEYDLQLIEDNSDVIELKGITITSYNNEESQTDSTPHIMASNRMVYEGAVAISRDLKEKHKLKWGDFVLLDSDRLYVIEDLMNERYKNQVDIFSFDKKLSKKINFKNQEIKIYKLKR